MYRVFYLLLDSLFLIRFRGSIDLNMPPAYFFLCFRMFQVILLQYSGYSINRT